MYKGGKKDASDLMKVVSHQRAIRRTGHVTCLAGKRLFGRIRKVQH